MKQLGPVIESILRRNNLWSGYQRYLIIEKWPDLVGLELSEVTKAVKITNGLLQVLVKDSVWSYHLSLLKPQLIKKLNDHVGCKVVNDIVFYIGDFEKKE